MTDNDSFDEQAADRAAAAGHHAQAAACLERVVCADPGRTAPWIKLSAMRRALGDTGAALAAINRALAMTPLDFSALLARAFLLDQRGDPTAGEAFGHAVDQQPDDTSIPPGLLPALARARQRSAEHRALVEQRMLSAILTPLDPDERERVERFVSNSARRTRHYEQQPSHFHYPGMPAVEFHDRSAFPALAAIEASTEEITAEFEALIAANAAEILPYIQYPERVPLRQWQDLNHNLDWSAIHLVQNGRRIAANADRCPRTLAVLKALSQPEIPGACPNAMFSLLAPHTRIPPHTGVANFRLVGHLPLIVPPNCGFRCGETRREWQKGQSFIFDDTIEHEAWNESDALRVVLIFDVWAPGISSAERTALATVVPAAGTGFSGDL